MALEGVFRRRHLPHWDVEGKPIFITACLEGSIPAAGIGRIRRYRRELDARPRPEQLSERDWALRKDKLLFAMVDGLLDHQSPVRHLADERQAEIVQNAFLHFAGERYALLAYVVMPSHHHWLFLPDERWAVEAVEKARSTGRMPGGRDSTGRMPIPRARERTPREIISQAIQSYTATMCNRLRGESGRYWQTETFDHWVRDEAEMLRIIDYIERNPVQAGLVERPEDWRWSSARLRKRTGTKPGDSLPKPDSASSLSINVG